MQAFSARSKSNNIWIKKQFNITTTLLEVQRQKDDPKQKHFQKKKTFTIGEFMMEGNYK